MTEYKERHYTNTSTGFTSDNKYRKQKDLEYEKLEKELKELEKGGDSEKEVVVEEKNKDDHDWKKRYSDVRSYSTKLQEELEKVKSELEEVKNKKEVKYPKTEEEIQEWVKEFPDVAAIIETIAGKQSDRVKEEYKKEFDEVQKLKQKLEFQRAYMKLLELQPDFDELRETEDFKNWLDEQPPVLQDAIFKPSLDDSGIKSASRVIDLYRKEKNVEQTNVSNRDKEAARSVSRTRNDTPDADDKIKKFKESEIAKMSTREYEKYEEQILEAQRKGPPYFEYDISGGAR